MATQTSLVAPQQWSIRQADLLLKYACIRRTYGA